jgi:hypothetical protein
VEPPFYRELGTALLAIRQMLFDIHAIRRLEPPGHIPGQ